MSSYIPGGSAAHAGTSETNLTSTVSSEVPTGKKATSAGKRLRKVTPPKLPVDSELARRLKVDKEIVNELLLVCGVIGTTTTTTTSNERSSSHNSHTNRGNGIGHHREQELLVPVTDCINWLQDLQRCLRRDDDLCRPISLLLGQWKIVAHKLLPLVLHSRFDTPLVLTVAKILVILTKPLASNTVNAGCMVIDTKSGKTSESVIQEQRLLRENAMQQAALLVEYKRIICHHQSHRRTKGGADGSSNEGGILSIFVSLLAEPLSRTGNSRTDADHLTIELVLHLFRNLLTAEPLLKTVGSEELHFELVSLLERELVLEILLVLSADIEQRENAPYNLLLMELLHLLLRHQNPVYVAQAGLPPASLPHRSRGSVLPVSGSLLGPLRREKQALAASATSRHSHFAGTLQLESSLSGGSGHRTQLVNAALLGSQFKATTGSVALQRKSKYADPFIGATSVVRDDLTASMRSPVARRAAETLHTFCQRFVANCYGPVMKSLKNEFRRDSVRLEDSDRIVLFQMVTFFSKWWRTAREIKTIPTSTDESDGLTNGIGHLIFTMDVFTFNLVLNAIDTYLESKKYGPLAHSVALLGEMLHLLHTMYSSNESQTEHIMAMGLMDRLFYGGDPLDRLPKLLSRWTLGTCTRQYLCDLIEVCHLSLQLLDTSSATARQSTTTTLEATKDNVDPSRFDTIAKMKASASEFAVDSYFARKIVSNHTVSMYTYLLAQYTTNSRQVNINIVTFFRRLCAHTLLLGDSATTESGNPLAAKPVTFEPMLYNVQLLTILNTILNDTNIRKEPDFAALIKFATSIIVSFARAARANPMLFAEALFKHPFPHRFCDLVTNSYVTDDLRMLAERDMLQQQHEQMQARAIQRHEEFSDEEELEFTDDDPQLAATAAVTTTTNDEVATTVDSDDSLVEEDGVSELEPTTDTAPKQPVIGGDTNDAGDLVDSDTESVNDGRPPGERRHTRHEFGPKRLREPFSAAASNDVNDSHGGGTESPLNQSVHPPEAKKARAHKMSMDRDHDERT